MSIEFENAGGYDILENKAMIFLMCKTVEHEVSRTNNTHLR